MTDDTPKRYINQKEFQGYIIDIARQISLSSWLPDIIVGLSRGGLVPATYLSHYLNIPLKILSISLRDHKTLSSDYELPKDAYEQRKILVIDDIVDTGKTLNWLMNDWQSHHYPERSRWDKIWGGNVKFASVVLNNPNECNVNVQFKGLEIDKSENDAWIVFPWEDFWLLHRRNES